MLLSFSFLFLWSRFAYLFYLGEEVASLELILVCPAHCLHADRKNDIGLNAWITIDVDSAVLSLNEHLSTG